MIIDEKAIDAKLELAGNNPEKYKAHLTRIIKKDLNKRRATNLYKISESSGLDPDAATGLCQMLYDKIEVPEGKKKAPFNLTTRDADKINLKQNEYTRNKARGYKLLIDPEYMFRVCFVSDTHIGSWHDNIEGLEEMFDRAHSIGVKYFYHYGDLVDGYFRRHRDMYKYLRPDCLGFDGQYERVVKLWPKRKGMTTTMIAGNHDHFAMDTADADIVSHIALARDDMMYIKSDSIAKAVQNKKRFNQAALEEVIAAKKLGSGRCGAVRIGPEGFDKNTILMMLHPGGGSAQTISYKPQQIVANIEMLLHSFENMQSPTGKRIKPHILTIGHYHKADVNWQRNVHIFQSATMKLADQFHEVRNLRNMMGYWLVELTTKPNGDITSILPHLQKPYVDPNRATRTVV